MAGIPSREEITKYTTIEAILAILILLFLTCALITETVYVSFDSGFSFGFMIVWHQFPSSIFSTLFTLFVYIYNALIIIFETTGTIPMWRSIHKQKLLVQGFSMVLIFIVGLMNSILANKNDFYAKLYKKRLVAISVFAWLTFIVQILQLIKYILEMRNFNVNINIGNSARPKPGNDRNNPSRVNSPPNTERPSNLPTFATNNTFQVEIDHDLEVPRRNN
uniref:MARVEL domain-containing protein n=1 Tax=Strongyloides stercoralis TaxID=6248 RepID=A0A0K0E0X6_STRER